MSSRISTEYQRLLEASPGSFLVLEPDGFVIRFVSDAYVASTGIARESMLGRGIFEVFFSQAGEMYDRVGLNLRASFDRVMRELVTDEMSVQKYDLQRPGGEAHDLAARYWKPVNKPVVSADGTLQFIIHSVEDVTAESLVRVGVRAADILESIHEGFFSLDREFRFTYVNGEAERILGSSRDHLLNEIIWNVYPGLIGHPFEVVYLQTMMERVPASSTAYYPDHERWYAVHASPTLGGIAVYFQDVTDDKRAGVERDRLVREQESDRRMYEAALSNTPDLVYVFDLQHRFMYANEALLAMWGKTREYAIGKTCLELDYEPWHAEMHNREIDTVAATRKAIRGEVPFNGTNGRRIYDYIFVPVFDANGAVVAVAGTTRDITDRQQAEVALREQSEQLRQADRVKDEFLATLAHELRNPLAPLRNSLSLLQLTGNNDSTMTSIHEMMERQVNHLVRLVDDLLETARINRGTFELRKEKIDVAVIVRNAIETSQPLIKGANHELRVELPPQPLVVDGDAVRLAQILANLLNNAAKYTRDGGLIELSVRAEGSTVATTVRDNGVGIQSEMLPRIFEMFSRGERSSLRAQGGLGIGLALSRRLAELHGGSVHAYSEGAGCGSEFVLRLPLTTTTDTGSHEVVYPKAPIAQERILVVDDNRDAALSLTQLLRFLGVDARAANDGREALELVHAFKPAVVLLDIGMPDMDGYDVARTIRARFPERAIALVALTGWGQEEDRRRSSEAGFDRHLVKPVDLVSLQTLLQQLAAQTN